MSGQLSISFMPRAIAEVEAHPDYFRPEFGEWLRGNWPLYERFEREALAVARRRQHYGANTIIEYLRHQTALADDGGEWKLNDRWTSSIARLFAVLNPSYGQLFEFRERKRDGVVLAPCSARRAA